jgi:hypothetical protein
VSDVWDDEGFGGEDDWEGAESVESDLEDAVVGFDNPQKAEDEDEDGLFDDPLVEGGAADL